MRDGTPRVQPKFCANPPYPPAAEAGLLENSPYNELLVTRRAFVVTPDLWMRVNWRTLRVELEAAGSFGRFNALDDSLAATAQDDSGIYESVAASDLNRRTLANFGYALEFKYGFLKDRFHVGLDQGFATGDVASSPHAPDAGAAVGINDDNDVVSNFRFNRAFNVDMLLFREILGTVSNAAYFQALGGVLLLRQLQRAGRRGVCDGRQPQGHAGQQVQLRHRARRRVPLPRRARADLLPVRRVVPAGRLQPRQRHRPHR
ncbi:hypothetical protein [Paraliomyxa miuraensis]|uniref:hypothetical protein n=1 Tax=Paraliomyxa miuraensis TaxID=376150 RepID=UPI0022592E31|nr:hypothetical protein [Paraliomyxa miuraensis]MCX4239099.1 hypothetical protein [Paraliomyxa miuraensis]